MPACTTSGPETRYNVALAQRKERCVTDERTWLYAINSFMNAGVLVQETNETPFIPNSTTYPDEFCVRPETAKLTTLKQTARVQIAFMFTVTLRMFASDPKRFTLPVPEWPSSSSCPPARAPGGSSHTHRKIRKHITRRTQSIVGGCSHTRHLCLGRDQHHLSVETIPIHFQSRGVIVSITRRDHLKCQKEHKTACVLDTKRPYYLKTETTNQISIVLGNILLHYRTLWATNWIQSHISTIQLCNKQAWHFNYLVTTKDDRLAVGVASLEEVMRLIRQLSETLPLRLSQALSNIEFCLYNCLFRSL